MAHYSNAEASANVQRRTFLKYTGGLILSAALPGTLLAKPSAKVLTFKHLHTGEQLKCCYWQNNQFNRSALAKINHILRDHRTHEVHNIDPQLIELLHKLHAINGSKAPYEIISGYRSSKTNEQLRKNSQGVAKKSLHMQGKAIDIRLADVDLKKLRNSAIAMQAGGVGYYPGSGFLHIDTGRPRHW